MSNKIQIKRSAANSTVSGLSNGELAFTANGKVFYIGDPTDGSSIRIGGEMVPGTLTANQALVANSTSGIDSVIVANLVPTFITANGAQGSNGQVLVSGGSGNVFWINQGEVSVNTAAEYTWTNTHTFQGNASFSGSNVYITASNTYISSNVTISGTNAKINSNTTLGGTNTSIESNVYISAANLHFTGANANFTSNVTITGANIDATSATLTVKDAVVSGNLTVSGTVTTINTQQLVVNDNIIELGSNNAGGDVFNDSIDSGWYVPTGNTDTTFYSGLGRIASASSNTNPYFRLFSTETTPNTSATFSIDNTGTLESFLAPFGIDGAFVVNSASVAVTANASVNVNIVANTLSLSSALAATSGGTGQNSYSSGDLLVANSGNILSKLSLGTSGYVLQSNGTALIYDILDGGTF